MVRRALFAATLALAAAPAAASAETELNVIPHGQQEPGVAWAGTAGMLPANAQALMYDRLTPLGRNVTDATLAPSADGTGYFKSAKLLDPERSVADHRPDDHRAGPRHDRHRAHPPRRVRRPARLLRHRTTA